MKINTFVVPIIMAASVAWCRADAVDEHLYKLADYFSHGKSLPREWQENGNGGYLMRLQIDVTGDGRDEVFLASTLFCDRFDCEWAVFDVRDDGTMRPYAGQISARGGWRWEENGKVYLVDMPGEDKDRAMRSLPHKVFRMFKFSYPTIETSYSFLTEEERVARSKRLQETPRKLEMIRLDRYLADKNAQWLVNPEIHQRGSDDARFVEGDEENAMANVNFTPQRAMELIQARKNPTVKSQEPPEKTPPDPEQITEPRHEPKRTEEQAVVVDRVESESKDSPLWLFMVAGLAVALAVLIVLKSRK